MNADLNISTTELAFPDGISPTAPAFTFRPVLPVAVRKLHPDAVMPTYAHEHDGCFDLYAVKGAVISGHSRSNFGTGLAFDIPQGYVMLVFSRSGMGINHGIRLANTTGVIDAGYHKEVVVSLRNDRTTHYSVMQGDRIAQAMIIPRPYLRFDLVEEFKNPSRVSVGLGGSGR